MDLTPFHIERYYAPGSLELRQAVAALYDATEALQLAGSTGAEVSQWQRRYEDAGRVLHAPCRHVRMGSSDGKSDRISTNPRDCRHRPVSERLAQAGVLLLPGSVYDQPPHVRVGFGRQNMPEALERLEAALPEAVSSDRRAS